MHKRALVTGASEGIGLEFARQLAKRGYAVTCVARSADKLQALTIELGAEHHFIAADLSTEVGTLAVVQALAQTHYDLLVNNAGVGLVGEFAGGSVERSVAMLRLNNVALVVLGHAFLSHSHAGDMLINVGSALAFFPSPYWAVYVASKAFVAAFTEALWFEQRSRGVYVMCLCPGLTNTNFELHASGSVRPLPRQFVKSPERLVHFALRNAGRRKVPLAVHGLGLRWLVTLSRLLPRKWLTLLMGTLMKARFLRERTRKA